jgi:hypothetical protein
MKKRRGHGWARRKGFSKKHPRAQKDNVESTATKITDEMKKQTRSKNQQPIPQFRQDFVKYNGHTTQCHYFGIRRGCMACYNEYLNGYGILASGWF